MDAITEKLSIKEKVGYALGDTASCLFWSTFTCYLMYFYTDVFGLPVAIVGTMLLLTRIIDIFIDPLIGAMADRTHTRFGSFRPYLLWMAVPFGLAGVLTFTTPDFTLTGKIIYAYFTYSIMMILYSLVNTPYSALLGVITGNSTERTSLSSYRLVFAFIGTLIVQGATLPLVSFYGIDNKSKGFFYTMLTYALLAIIILFFSFASTKERIRPVKNISSTFKQDLLDLIHNKQIVILLGYSIFSLMSMSLRAASIIYYFKYFIGNENMSTAFLLAGTIANVAGIVVLERLSARIDKRKTMILLSIVATISSAVLFFAGPHDLVFIFGSYIVFSLIWGPNSALIYSFFGDAADYSEWKTERRATGLIFSSCIMANKLGWAIGGGLAGWLLAYFGFKANVVQTLQVTDGIKLLMSVIPAAFTMVAAFLMFFSKLDAKTVNRVAYELEVRRKNN